MTATAEHQPATDQRGTGKRLGVLAPQYRALTIGMVALTTLVAFEAHWASAR